MKPCNKCSIPQELSEYWKNCHNSDGLMAICKTCLRQFRKDNHDRLSLVNKKFNEKYKNEKTPEKIENKKIYNKRYLDKNPDYFKNYYQSVKDRVKLKSFDPEYKANKNRRAKLKYHTDPLFKLKISVSAMTHFAFKRGGWSKCGKSLELLGASYEVVKVHIERQFQKGMNWDNHGKGDGKWNIDHKIPLASAKTDEELIKLCHYRNLQPLWAIDNIKKSDKIIPHQLSITL